MTRTLTAIIEREGDLYVATCPYFDVITQGHTIQEAQDNLKEAVELSPAEKMARDRPEFYVTDVEVTVG